MFAVFAAEQQYHHDTRTRENERRILASIRERSAVAPLRLDAVSAPRTTDATVRTARAAWPRPIGLHVHEDSATACAAA
ncbi:hypothetical protein [Microbacterium sp. NPDC058389]|uniref:hypothetical protein n=1 Tax=Microbacterium sp. NPDC058389 TaxID=3346475 RepID=UPI0036560445